MFSVKCRTSSWGSKGLAKAEANLLKGCGWKVGNGVHIRSFGHPWLYNRIPKAHSSITLCQALCSKVKNLIIVHPSPHWNIPLVRQLCCFKNAQAILSMELPQDNSPYFMIWKHHVFGQLTCKNGYAFLSSLKHNLVMNNDNTHFFFKKLWHCNIQPKWKIFLWELSMIS